jgi:hypothetical protein
VRSPLSSRSAVHFASYAPRFTSHVSRFTFHVLRFAFLLSLLTIGWVPAPQGGGVAGQVSNGTPGGSVPAGLPVTLYVFSGEEEADAYTTTLADDGSFRFDDVSLAEGAFLQAGVFHHDVEYLSEPVAPEPGQQELVLPVVIYETTEDPSTVQVTQLHLFLFRQGDRLQMAEYYLIGNTGHRTYVGVEESGMDRRTTLTFSLPDGAENLSFDGPGLGERFVEREGEAFVDTFPISPGSTTAEVSFGYELPYREGMQVARVFDMPVNSVVLVPMEEGLVLRGEGLTLMDGQETGMGPAVSYAAGPLAAGEPLVFTLSTHPQTAADSSVPVGTTPGRDTAREVSIGLVALAAAVVVGYLLLRSPAFGPLPAQARPLVENIAALDANFEAGQVSEKSYNRKRRTLKRQLRALFRDDRDT